MRFTNEISGVHFNSIMAFLDMENEECGHSFSCNKSLIERAFNEGWMCCALSDDSDDVKAFIVYSISDKIAELEIMCVDYRVRGEGFGTFLLSQFELFLISQGEAFIISGNCQPPESETFWRSRGFLNYPNTSDYNGYSSVYLYKSLYNVDLSKRFNDFCVVIELWDEDYYSTSVTSRPPDAMVFINEGAEDIVFTCFYDQPARMTYGGVSIEEKLKRTPLKFYRKGDFIIIKHQRDLIASMNAWDEA
jgi:hypothetical protein